MYMYILLCTGMYLDEMSIYWYIPVHTSTYWYVLLCTCVYCYIPMWTAFHALYCQPYFVGTMPWYKGVHHQHKMSCYSTYWQIRSCTNQGQVYRILREMTVYWPVLTKNRYELVRTAVQVSTRSFPLESYTPDVGRYRSVFVSMYYSMTFHAKVQLMMYSLVPWHGAHKTRQTVYSMKSSTHRYIAVHTGT